MNYATSGSPATFYVDLPASGTYNLALAMGDDGYSVMFGPVPDSVPGWQHRSGYAYERARKRRLFLRCAREQLVRGGLANQEPQSAGCNSRHATDDDCGTNYTNRRLYSHRLPWGDRGHSSAELPHVGLSDFAQRSSKAIKVTSTITTNISGGFNSAISFSASGLPSGATANFNPNPIPAPGAGSTTMTITVGSSTPLGTLSHHGDGQWRRHPAERYSQPDSDSDGLHIDCFASNGDRGTGVGGEHNCGTHTSRCFQ